MRDILSAMVTTVCGLGESLLSRTDQADQDGAYPAKRVCRPCVLPVWAAFSGQTALAASLKSRGGNTLPDDSQRYALPIQGRRWPK
jgi:hypothetical protein